MKRIQAKALGLKTYSTGKPCRYGHTCERYTSNFTCIECSNKQSVNWMLSNKNQQLQKRRECYALNSEHYRNYSSAWARNNRSKMSVNESRRKERTKKATPPWLTKEHYSQMYSFYWLANLQYELTDTKYHVDHVVPILGKTVCGLNVPWNMQILEAKENIRKSNKFMDNNTESMGIICQV